MKSANYIIEQLDILFPDAHCELNHKNNFELLIAVILSAQTTDQKVNGVTSFLFKNYDSPYKLANAKYEDVESILRPLGLSKNKTKNIIATSQKLVNDYGGEVPSLKEELLKLNGVGNKTANIILNNCFNVPAFAVDTHVSRVSKRLGIAKMEDDVSTIEEKLMAYFPKSKWGKLHHQFIFFGRYKCKAIKPDCLDCPFARICDKVS